MTERTPDYDTRNNSRLINFLLSGIDGGFVKKAPLCSPDDYSTLTTKSAALGQFPLFNRKFSIVNGIISVLCGGVGVYSIVSSIVFDTSLAITIPVGIVSFAFCALFGSTLIFSSGAQHRYVLVELDCSSGGEDHSVLYDCITKQKRRRFGTYTNVKCQVLQSCQDRNPYSEIEKAFEEMPGKLGSPYNPFAYNCKDWADDLFAKISNIEN
ncbi:unnamed protein product [Auanema sp. JU1783]|nr:unnamed protein product [Auanema sp. JU1783]